MTPDEWRECYAKPAFEFNAVKYIPIPGSTELDKARLPNEKKIVVVEEPNEEQCYRYL